MALMLTESLINELETQFQGRLIVPVDADYEIARRVHNGMIDKRPALIARCSSVADVVTALQFGLGNHLPIAVRGGGHNVAGKAVVDDGIVIDLSAMKEMRVDPATQVAWAQAGLTWGDFDRETQMFGLATTGGEVSSTGIAGLTLGGGIGYLQRKHGLTCDNLLSADVVTAHGRLLTASETANSDLFWGLRGGGGNLGIVTSFRYRLHPVGKVLAGPVLHPLAAAKEAFSFYRDYSYDAPDEVAALYALSTLPDGEWGVLVFVCHSDGENGEKVIEPVRRFGNPLQDLISPMGYRDVQTAFDADMPWGGNHYWKSLNLIDLPDDAIDTIISFIEAAPSARPMVFLERFGGAVARVPDDATAYGHRNAEWDLVIAAMWGDVSEQEAHVEWARSFFAAMEPYSDKSVYVNYLSDEGEQRVKAAYGAENYARMVTLKQQYDPTNIFRNNQNIRPDS